MKSNVYLIKGLYTDRVVLLFNIGQSAQSIIVGYSELENFFAEQQIQYIIAGNDFEMMEITPHFTIGKNVLTIQSGESVCLQDAQPDNKT